MIIVSNVYEDGEIELKESASTLTGRTITRWYVRKRGTSMWTGQFATIKAARAFYLEDDAASRNKDDGRLIGESYHGENWGI